MELRKESQQSDARKRYEDALALDIEGKMDEAIEAYVDSIRIWPNIAQAHFNLGVKLAAQGKLDQAIRSWKRAVWLKRDLFLDLIKAFDIDDEMKEIVI